VGPCGTTNAPSLIRLKNCRGVEILNCRRVSRVEDATCFPGTGVFAHVCPDIRIENNILWRTRYAIRLIGSPRAVVRRNTLAGKSVVMVQGAPDMTFTHNILYEDYSFRNTFLSVPARSYDRLRMDHNLYYARDPELGFLFNYPKRKTYPRLRDWKAASGLSRHSLVADPLFVDPEKKDYRLKPGSPALEDGKVVIGSALSHGSALR
jgi:hypothetical protein